MLPLGQKERQTNARCSLPLSVFIMRGVHLPMYIKRAYAGFCAVYSEIHAARPTAGMILSLISGL